MSDTMTWIFLRAGSYQSMNLEYAIKRGPIGWEVYHGSTLILIADRLTDAKWYGQAHVDGRHNDIAGDINKSRVLTQADLDKWTAAHE